MAELKERVVLEGHKMKKFLAVLITGVLSQTLFLSSTRCADGTAAIGVTVPLTGDYAFIGEEIRRGFTLAGEEGLLNDARIIYEDTKGIDRVKAVTAAHKLSSVDHIQLAFDMGMTTAVSMAPIYEARGIPMGVILDYNHRLETLGNHVFGIGYSTEAAGEDMLAFAKDHLHAKRIAMLSMNEEWSQTISDAFRKALMSRQGKPVLDMSFDYGEPDVRSIAVRVVQAKPDAVYAPLFGISLHAVVRQLRTLGYKGQILVGDACIDEDIKSLSPLIDGAYATQVLLDAPQYVAGYKRRFGENSLYRIGFSALGYDAGMIVHEILAALKQEKRPLTAANISDKLGRLTLDGISGKIGLSRDNPIVKREKIVLIRSGEFVKP